MQTQALDLCRQLPGLSLQSHMCFCKQLSRAFVSQYWNENRLLGYHKLHNNMRGRDGWCIDAHSRDLPAILWATPNLVKDRTRLLKQQFLLPRAYLCFHQLFSSLWLLFRVSGFWTDKWRPAMWSRRKHVLCIQEQRPLYGTASLLCIFGLRC